MRSLAASLVLTLALGCALRPGAPEAARETVGAERQPFDSNESVLVDFAIEGKLVAETDDPAALDVLIKTQLLYSVGALNEDRSVGRHDRLTIGAVTAKPAHGARRFDVRYRATLPVAWGSSTVPQTHSLTLPARVAASDQQAFAKKYGKDCVDETVGEPDAGWMFLRYRPHRAGCVLDPSDVVVLPAVVSPSAEDTTGKYPEYQRVWEDGALDVVAVFSRAGPEPGLEDAGARAFTEFVAQTEAYLHVRQPDATKRTAEGPAASVVRRAATLPDGRAVHIDAALVDARLAREGAAFDAWYDALTPGADLILYSGHAGAGANIRALMAKGVFVPRKYLVWMANGCDTLAYVDRTLVERRAALNPDDPGGTKYLDTVSNVMLQHFSTNAATTSSFVAAMIAARDVVPPPKTYREIFSGVAREQVIVVTGEEDNEFDPSMFARGEQGRAPPPPPPTPRTAPAPREEVPREGGCAIVAASTWRGRQAWAARLAPALALVAAAVGRRRRRAPS